MYSAWLGRVWVGKDKRWEGDFPPHRWDQHMNPEIRCKDSAWGELTQVSAVGSIFLVFRLWSADLRFTALCRFTEAAVSSAVRTCAAHAAFILAGVKLEWIQWVDLSIKSLTLTVIISHTLFFTLNHHSKLTCLSCFELHLPSCSTTVSLPYHGHEWTYYHVYRMMSD